MVFRHIELKPADNVSLKKPGVTLCGTVLKTLALVIVCVGIFFAVLSAYTEQIVFPIISILLTSFFSAGLLWGVASILEAVVRIELNAQETLRIQKKVLALTMKDGIDG